jgi:hypothetical protein
MASSRVWLSPCIIHAVMMTTMVGKCDAAKNVWLDHIRQFSLLARAGKSAMGVSSLRSQACYSYPLGSIVQLYTTVISATLATVSTPTCSPVQHLCSDRRYGRQLPWPTDRSPRPLCSETLRRTQVNRPTMLNKLGMTASRRSTKNSRTSSPPRLWM